MNLLIIQARMGSTRLPGKVLELVGGKPVLQQLVDRIRPAKKVDQILIVTTTNPEDDALEAFCAEHEWPCFRGSDWDVLDRFYQGALTMDKPTTVIRLTSDCPLHHAGVVDFCVDQYEQRGVDFFSNSGKDPDVQEDGFDVEVFSFAALETAWTDARLLSEREHVTPYIKGSGRFSCAWQKAHPQYQYKLSVDTKEDMMTVEQIFKALAHQPDFGMADVVALVQAQPELLEPNKESIINSGYQKSLDNDREVD